MNDTIKKLIGDGVFLVPAAEKSKAAKMVWKDQPALNEFELQNMMRHFQTTGIAMNLGASGLCCADLDTKKYAGFEVGFLDEVRELYPEIWERLRVEKTPSGGFHLLWRLPQGYIQESKNIAYRWCTEKEREEAPKVKKVCFIEIKSTGALSQCFPSPGYTLLKEANGEVLPRIILGLTQDQHASLVNLCSSYNECFEPEKLEKTGSILDIYDENPFSHFNRSDEGENVLEDSGWILLKGDSRYKYFKKPGRKGKDVDASFNIQKRIYKIWTNTTDLEDRSYTPSGLKGILLFSGAEIGKEMYHWLVANGYGKIKSSVEKNLIKREAKKKDGGLPENASFQAKLELEREKLKYSEIYPFGIFWKELEDGGFKISRTEFLRVADELGFKRVKQEFVYIDGYILRYIDEKFFFNVLHKYLKEDSLDMYDSFEAFLQSSGKWSMERFKELDKDLILSSSAKVSYKFYTNCYVKITQEGEEILSYQEIQGLIWEDKIKNREYKIKKDYRAVGSDGFCSLYYDFLNKSIGVDKYLMQCVGYYAHEFRDQRGYMVIATEKCENPKEGGGYGKNIFWELLNLTTTFKSVPASQLTLSKDLLQSWNKQRIFVASDMDKGFNLSFFKDIITGNAVVNKKYINEYDVAIEDMPKIGGSSNYTYDLSYDGGLKRRIRYLEFGDFFKKHKGVDKYYGKMFPKDWDDYEYTWFDNFIHDCIIEFLKCDYEIIDKEISEGGWVKQFTSSHGHLVEFYDEIVNRGSVGDAKFVVEYESYCRRNNIRKNFEFSMKKVRSGIEEYCKHFDTTIEIGSVDTGEGVAIGMRFIKEKDILILEDAPF